MFRYFIVFFVIFNSVVVDAGNENISIMTESSYKNIVISHQENPFLIVLWSLDCPPCIEELKVLQSFTKKYPNKKIILISTDSSLKVVEINNLLKENSLQSVEAWVFSDNAMQSRYSIDPIWYGEVPRSYFYWPKQNRKAYSGRLKYSILEEWFIRDAAKN